VLKQLEQVEKRYAEIEHRLCDPSVLADVEQFRRLSKEGASLEPLVSLCRRYRAVLNRVSEAQALLSSKENAELWELAEQELCEAQTECESCEKELKAALVPQDPNDNRNVILEIRAGAGGEESALFAASLFRMYSMYAEAQGFSCEVLSVNATELKGYKEVCAMISGHGAYSRFKYESGVHRVQRVPETESGGRIHTSTATVAVLPEAEDVELDISPSDLQIDTFRASGAGGQHINKTESAIRITHIPTGMVVECQDERSQFKNKDKAMRVLRSRLLEAEQTKQQQEISADRKAQVGSGNRNERIRTYNFPQGRVTDHRIGLTLYRIDAIMNGDLTEIMDALATAERAQKLGEGEGE